jgi:DNA-binding NarL/FixJ family response regulator
MAEPTRVVLADDDVLLRAGLAGLLEGAGFEVVGQADDGGQLLNLVRAMTPDLVVTDIRMPPTNTSEGLDAARQIRQELPGTAIMALSAHRCRRCDGSAGRGGPHRLSARTRLGAQAGRPAERAERARE